MDNKIQLTPEELTDLLANMTPTELKEYLHKHADPELVALFTDMNIIESEVKK